MKGSSEVRTPITLSRNIQFKASSHSMLLTELNSGGRSATVQNLKAFVFFCKKRERERKDWFSFSFCCVSFPDLAAVITKSSTNFRRCRAKHWCRTLNASSTKAHTATRAPQGGQLWMRSPWPKRHERAWPSPSANHSSNGDRYRIGRWKRSAALV
jgi:hypothetical protein